MRSKTRNETPKPGAYNTHAAPKDKARNSERVTSVNFYDTIKTERSKAMAALAMMKELERKRKKHMVSVRIDDRTVVNVAKGREEEIVKELKSRKL